MEVVLRFLARQTKLVIALAEDNIPHIRVLPVVKFVDKIIYFAISDKDEIYDQLKNNPTIEVLGIEGNTSVKIKGTAGFTIPDTIKQEIFHNTQLLQRLHQNIEELRFFKIPIESIDYYDLNTIPPTLLSFT